MKRQLRFLPDTLINGISYGVLNYLIHSPKPLDEQATWDFITRREPDWQRWMREAYPPSWMRKLVLRRAQYRAANLGIEEHYDVSNEFYKLFLDRELMFYSCADHVTGHETLEQAQVIKANHLLSLIDPKPGQRIAELGCGWCSMLRHVEKHTGDRDNLWGYTLSKEQFAHNAQHYGYHVKLENFVTTTYEPEFYDTIYSIAAWEAIRPQEVDTIVQKVYAALKPGGRFVLHFFCRLQDKLPAAISVAQLFFPGHVPTSYRMHVQAFERAGFRITHTSVHDYRPTLRDWFDNMVARRDEALKLVGTETYNRYVVFFPASWKYFDERTGALFRFVLRKPPIDSATLHVIPQVSQMAATSGS
ncbi:MAG: class I SAM-dependent methyltransferase [Planctomycetes bacterium]|nr:class I SAM-dependent methyltransferase [Planctomycetota bacterium]